MALAAYRHLMRAVRIAFEGDSRTLTAAQDQIRSNFRNSAALASTDPAVAPAIKHAEDIATMLRTNIVQGVRKEGDDIYKLRIHKDTERGDNDTVKIGGQTVKIDGRTCADR